MLGQRCIIVFLILGLVGGTLIDCQPSPAPQVTSSTLKRNTVFSGQTSIVEYDMPAPIFQSCSKSFRGKLGVIDASDDRLVEETEKALLSLPKARSIILDFRSSCEQYPMTAQVVPFCNLFLEDSVVISFATANKREEKRTSAEAKFKGRLIALIDSTVGFQSEMICSALKHNNRAILVGDTTVCKPILMSRVFLVEGGSFCFNLSTGEYFQPDGSKFDTGLKPTISLPLVTSDFESGKGPWWYFNKTLTTNELKDSQLKRAIELLNDES